MEYAQALSQKVLAAIEANDRAALHALFKEHFQKAKSSEAPFGAAIEVKPKYKQELGETQFEGSGFINWANRIARAERLVAYRLKTMIGFKGTHIVSEGDSWFQYPFLLSDVIDNFDAQDEFAVLSLGAAGDLVKNMAARREYSAALRDTGARVMLLSGGGNDLLGEGKIAQLLIDYTDGATAAELINTPALDAVSDEILGHYADILSDVQTNHPGVTVFGHGYDTPYPKSKGKYFGKPFKSKGIPLELGREVIALIVDSFAARLQGLADQFSNYRFVNLKDTVGRSSNSWFDELHPRSTGFGKAARPIMKAVANHVKSMSADGLESASFVAHDALVAAFRAATGMADTGPASPAPSSPAAASPAPSAASASSGQTIVLDPGHGGDTNHPGASWNNAIGPSGTLEKNWTLDVCTRAKAVLEQRGYTVLMTRSSDVSVSGASRCAVAKNAAADCFISVHFNASNAHNAQGTETYVHTNTTSADSISLMRNVQNAMVAELGLKDRNASRTTEGVLRGGYYVISEAKHAENTAVCLHEVSFMDREDEENRIKTSSYRDRIARALADGVDAYFGGGFESATSFESATEDFDDAIHENAARMGMSVTQYLGLAEAPAHSPHTHVDGSALEGAAMFESPAAPASLMDAMWADATRSSDADEGNEDRHIDAAAALDFSRLGQNPAMDRAMFESAFSGFESAGFDYGGFEAFVASLNLRYFTATELLYMGAGNGSGNCQGKNGPPPKTLWNNIAATAQMLDEIRHRLGHPITILSGYRNDAYNACVGGKPGSVHKRFNAIDWTSSGGTNADWHRIAKEVRGENANYTGGIGRYISKNFIHVDTRGIKRDWTKA